MPTRKKGKKSNPSATAVLKKQRTRIIKEWTNLFPEGRWTRREAREISTITLDAIIGYFETARSGPLLSAVKPILSLAAKKEAALSSGLSRMAAAKRILLRTLLDSNELDRKELRSAILGISDLFDSLGRAATGSVLRKTSAGEELIRRVSVHKGILDNPSLAVFAADPKGRTVMWSRGAELVSGINLNAIKGRKLPPSLREVGTGVTHEASNTEVLRAFAALSKRLGLPPAKHPRHLITTVSRVLDDAGVFLGTVGVALDVTKIATAQKRLEELAQIIDSSADSIVQIDPDGKVIYWNKGAEKLTGFSSNEALGRDGLFFVKWKRPGDYSNMLRTLKKHGRWKDELIGLRKDGTIYDVIASATALCSSTGNHIGSLIVGTDISGLKSAQTKIAEQARLLDQTNEAIVQTDADGKVVFWNRGAEILTGYGGKEALGQGPNFLKSVSPDYDRKRMLEVFKEGKVFTRELRLVRRDGRPVPVVVSHTPLRSRTGTYLGAIAVATDVTELKQTREKVREQADLIDRAKDAIIRTDSEGRMVFWNRGAEVLTGYTKGEAIGKPWSFFTRICPALDRETVLARVRKKKVFRGDMAGVRKDGSSFTALVSLTPLYSSPREYKGMLGIATDVTHLRDAERKVAESQELLQTVLNTIDDLVAVVDQDLRLVYSNRAIKKYTGFAEEDFRAVGGPYYMMPDDEKRSVEAVARRLRTARGPYTVELSIPTKRGEARRAEWRAVRIDDKEPGKYKIVSVGRDMTTRLRSEEESKLLLELNSALGKSLDLNEIAPEALAKTMKVLKADAGLVAILEEENNSFSLLVHRGMEPAVVSRLKRRGSEEGWTGEVIRTGKPLIIENVRESKYATLAYPETIRGGYLSFACIPLKFQKRVFGVIEMASRRASQFKRSDLKFITSVANVLSSALYNARLHSRLEEQQRDLIELSKKLTTVEEDERRRIAADLHDETGQLLAAARANLQMTAKQLTKANPRAISMLEEAAALVGKALDQVRDVSHGLHPALLHDVGLSAAIKWLAQKTRETGDVKVRVRSRGAEQRLPSSVEASLFRAVQEILNNATRHSRAEKVKIDVRGSTSGMKIKIEDDGIGFNVEEELQKPRGLGLRTLKQRVRWLGGEIKLQSEPGKGTLVELEVPMEAWENEDD
jgi:PAS domain S-box-containing protein